MRIEKIDQPAAGDLITGEEDLILVASGYESRSRYIAELTKDTINDKTLKHSWAFVEHSNTETRKVNDRLLKSLNYRSTSLKEGALGAASSLFIDDIAQLPSKPLHVLIDISSMTRAWYGGIVRALMQLQHSSTIATRFVYVPAEYSDPPANYPPNEVLAPVPGFTSLSLPDKPTALIIGLGYDPDRALGLNDHLDPQMTLLFHADPGSDPRYARKVVDVNKGLIEIVGRHRLFSYPLDDSVAIYKLLESASRGLLRDWRLVLCSLGPKPFGLICFLLAAYYEEISIWRVSAGAREAPVDRKPKSNPILLDVEWAPPERPAAQR